MTPVKFGISKEMIAIAAVALTLLGGLVSGAMAYGKLEQKVATHEIQYAKIDQKLDRMYELLLAITSK
jgi:hypothetical protein